MKVFNFVKISNGVKIRSIRNIKNLAGKKVLLRLDFNVPIKNEAVKDDYKIVTTLPTIRFLLRHKCRLVIATHLSDASLSAKPIAARLARLLGRKVLFVGGVLDKKAVELIKEASSQDLILLDNLRFNKGEERNDKEFARGLASLAQIYVNDGFAVSHRNHASVSAIKKYLPSYAGLSLEKEILNLEKVLKPRQPLIAIVGGAKIETKIAMLNNLAKKSERILIGGALANDFMAAHGFKIGKSFFNQASLKTAAELIKRHKNIILPVDAVVVNKVKSKNLLFADLAGSKGVESERVKVKPVSQVKPDEIILDIGPKTVKLFANFIRKANTIIWNGPLGYFENTHFKHGTLSIARLVAARSTGEAYGVVGGGETIEAIKMTKMENYIDWVSTGGGALLAFLGGEPMPGLKGIVK